jgi:hypothetical protein
MSWIMRIIFASLVAYTVGTVAGPVALGSVTEAKESLSPFMFISAAILIASIGYAVGAIRRSPFAGRDPREEMYR